MLWKSSFTISADLSIRGRFSSQGGCCVSFFLMHELISMGLSSEQDAHKLQFFVIRNSHYPLTDLQVAITGHLDALLGEARGCEILVSYLMQSTTLNAKRRCESLIQALAVRDLTALACRSAHSADFLAFVFGCVPASKLLVAQIIQNLLKIACNATGSRVAIACLHRASSQSLGNLELKVALNFFDLLADENGCLLIKEILLKEKLNLTPSGHQQAPIFFKALKEAVSSPELMTSVLTNVHSVEIISLIAKLTNSTPFFVTRLTSLAQKIQNPKPPALYALIGSLTDDENQQLSYEL